MNYIQWCNLLRTTPMELWYLFLLVDILTKKLNYICTTLKWLVGGSFIDITFAW